ncbi:MAG: DUF4920 domain-containing protein, partial [Ignavibacteria bacterium]|nr:DUF4920 domain-containing protein [Ignavibacteria bacterium]
MNIYKTFFSFFIALLVSLTFSCGEPSHNHDNDNQTEEATTETLPSTGSFGENITKDGAVAINEIASLINSDEETPVKVYGTILEVCQHTGCWVTFDLGNGEEIMINMKDHEFFVPKDAA